MESMHYTSYMEGSDLIEWEVKGNNMLPCVYEGAEFFDGIMAHVHSTKLLQQVDRFWNCAPFTTNILLTSNM